MVDEKIKEGGGGIVKEGPYIVSKKKKIKESETGLHKGHGPYNGQQQKKTNVYRV